MLLRCDHCNLVIDLPDATDEAHRVCSQCRGPLSDLSEPRAEHDDKKTRKLRPIKPPEET